MARIMKDITMRDYWVIMNDFLFIGSLQNIGDLKIPIEVIESTKYALDKAGYKEWIAEED